MRSQYCDPVMACHLSYVDPVKQPGQHRAGFQAVEQSLRFLVIEHMFVPYQWGVTQTPPDHSAMYQRSGLASRKTLIEEVSVGDREARTPEERARERAKEYVGLLWHLAVFVIVNGFLWALDLLKGDGLNWAYLVTIMWGIGLAFHIAAYWLDGSGFQDRAYRRFLAKEEDSSPGD